MRLFRKESSVAIWRWFDRLLLLTVVALQLVLVTRKDRSPEPEVERAALEDSATARDQSIAVNPIHDIPDVPWPRESLHPVEPPRPMRSSQNRGWWIRPRGDNMDPEGMLSMLTRGWDSIGRSPAMDIADLPDEYVVVCSLPGVVESGVKVRLDEGLLTIDAQYSRIDAGGGGGSIGHLFRQIQLPGIVSSGEPHFVITNDMLQVHLPKP